MDSDRAWALALLELEADVCQGCGHPRSETTEADAEFAYTASVGRCHACAAIARAQRRFTDGAPESATDGLTFTVTRDRS